MQVLTQAIGIIFALAAAWLIYMGFEVETSGLPDLTMLHSQAMLFHLGVGAAVVAAIFLAAAIILAAIDRRSV